MKPSCETSTWHGDKIQAREILCISQTAYIEGMLEKFGLAVAKPVRSPQMQNESTLRVEKDAKLINDAELPIRKIVGSLQYLVHCTIPGLANAVRTLGRYGSAYTKETFRQARRIEVPGWYKTPWFVVSLCRYCW